MIYSMPVNIAIKRLVVYGMVETTNITAILTTHRILHIHTKTIVFVDYVYRNVAYSTVGIISPCKIICPCAKPFSNKYTTKYITGPTSVDNLASVTSQAISSQAITSLEIDIPTFDDTDGPIRYVLHTYLMCIVINLTLFPTAVTTLL